MPDYSENFENKRKAYKNMPSGAKKEDIKAQYEKLIDAASSQEEKEFCARNAPTAELQTKALSKM